MNGRYKKIKKIGEGAQAKVFLVEDTNPKNEPKL